MYPEKTEMYKNALPGNLGLSLHMDRRQKLMVSILDGKRYSIQVSRKSVQSNQQVKK